jgi:hypothetical protein
MTPDGTVNRAWLVSVHSTGWIVRARDRAEAAVLACGGGSWFDVADLVVEELPVAGEPGVFLAFDDANWVWCRATTGKVEGESG